MSDKHLIELLRAEAETFHVTQAFLTCMPGVRRVGVTAAAGALQGSGLMAYTRGAPTVLDRAGLQHMACDCQETDPQSHAAPPFSGPPTTQRQGPGLPEPCQSPMHVR